MSEMLVIAKQKENLVRMRAKENQAVHTSNGYKQLSANLQKVNSAKEAASLIGSSERSYHYMKFIDENSSLLSEDEFDEWDRGEMSTHKAYRR